MELRDFEAIYPLSPLQEALLSKFGSASDGAECAVQLNCRLRGKLDVSIFEAAWNQIIDRHAILRSSFVWKRLDAPLQMIHKRLKVPVRVEDLRNLDALKQNERLQSFTETERQKRFDPSRSPLIRLAIFIEGVNAFYFTWTFHRLLLDEYSAAVILEEVIEAYDAISKRREANQNPRRSFRDYIAWVKRRDLSHAEAFWRSELDGFKAPNALPVIRDSERAHNDETSCVQVEFSLPLRLAESLRSLANNHELTRESLLLTAWGLILNRYSGDEDIVYGVAMSAGPRSREGADDVLGPLTNTLPLRVQVDERSSVSTLLRLMQRKLSRLREYDYVPLEMVQSWSEVPVGLSLFESSVNLEDHKPDLRFSNLNELIDAGDLKFRGRQAWALNLIIPPEDKMDLKITYDSNRIESDTIARMIQHFQTLLSSIATNPEQIIAGLPMLTEGERIQLLLEWNDTTTDYPDDTAIHKLFEAQAERTPEATAIIFEDQRLTYAELNRRANQLAHHLQAMGVGAEVLVGICAERDPIIIVAILAILKAGGAFLPMDPAYPLDRLAFMLEDSRMAVLLTQQRLAEALPAHWVQVVCLDSDWEAIAECEEENPQSPVAPLNLAYAIYTSGSTGKPKGALLQHQGLCNMATALIREFYIEPGGRFLQLSSLSFDASIPEIFATLTAGAAICLGTQESLMPGPQMVGLLKDKAITNAIIPPSLLAALPVDDLGSLATIIVAGEACSPDLVKRWGIDRRFINAYGPTEATVCATSGLCKADGEKPSIGRPIANVGIYILDRCLRPVPVGVTGELYIRSVGLARGYLNRPDLTAERFLPNPFATEPGERLYRTGDLARFQSDGGIEFVGRVDHQVKVRGLRIELGEIEMALIAHPDIDDAAVILHEQNALDKQIIAYVVSRKTSTSPGELRSFLREKLPDFMLPSHLVMLDRMPLTLSGKIDRSALPSLESIHAESHEYYVAPRDSVEETLAAIWSEMLSVDRVSIGDNFFELGGHSMLIGQIVARVREAFTVDLKLRAIFDAPTVAELATVIRQGQGKDDASGVTRIQARPRGNKSMDHLLAEIDQVLEDKAKQAAQAGGVSAGPEDLE